MNVEKLKQKTYNLLRKSEKYFKTDMVYLFKGGGWLTLGQIFSTISGLLLAIAFANFIPKEIYGSYKYILSIVGIIGAFSLTGMGIPITQSVSRGIEGILKRSFRENIKWSMLMLLISLIGFIYYYIKGDTRLAFSLLIVSATYPILQSATFYRPFLVGKREFKTSVILEILRNIIHFILILFTILLTNNLMIIITVYSLSYTTTALLSYFFTIKKYKPNSHINDKTLNFGKHLSLMNMLGIISKNIENVLLFHYFGASKLAIYIFATALPRQFIFIKKGLATLALPKLSNKSIPELKKILPSKALKLLFVLIPIDIAYILISPYLYIILFPQYIESIIYSQTFSLFILFFPVMFFNQALLAHSKKKYLYIINTTTPIVRIIVLLILLPILGIWGAIWSFLFTGLFSSIMSIYLFYRLK